MASYVKSKLKAAKDALGKKDFEVARDAALGVLDYEPENYTANVFLGLSLLKLGDVERSEQVYRKATEISPDQVLAWQGLSQLYEQAAQWDKYIDIIERLAKLFAQKDDATKCAEMVQRIIELRRDTDKSTPLQLADALSLFLPDSEFYPVLSTLPPPDATNPTSTTTFVAQSAVHNTLPILEEIMLLREREEALFIEKEIKKRRERLGAPPLEQIRKDVGRETWSSSKLPDIYNEIINHPNTSDDLRREMESKLLRYKQNYLYTLPTSGEFAAEKQQIAREVEELVNGMVLLEVHDELPWTLYIESKDVDYIEDYDYSLLRRFMHLFPASFMSLLIKGYFGYNEIPMSEDEEDDTTEQGPGDEDIDYADITIEAFGGLPDSILAHRIVAELYEQEYDLPNAIKVAENGLALVRKVERNNGKEMPRVRKAFNVVLATSLIHHYPPKHHSRALGIVSDVLSSDPEHVRSLMGRGYILQHAGKWKEAIEIFRKVVELSPDDPDDGLRAKEELAWCYANIHDHEQAISLLKEVIAALDDLEGREEDKARCWWRLGKCHWDMGDDTCEEAYRHFITSLKSSPTFAPAFTSLGVYYAEFASPPDPNRASKCFQKAFELDPREGDAARRLAEGFAEEREWDLVEVVARRTIEGEGGLEGGSGNAPATRYSPVNAWAWKAVGVVDLNQHRYPSAIQSFQVALRADANDQLSWLRLGEAYSKAGRFSAAHKALARARELDPEDWICHYFIGEVQRQTSEFHEAIRTFLSILETHPTEIGVLSSLSQTYLDQGRQELASAFFARAEQSFISSIETALQLISASSGFRRVAWKTAADAIYQLSQLLAYTDPDTVKHTLAKILPAIQDKPAASKGLSDILPVPLSLEEVSDLSSRTLEIAIAAYDYRISLGSLDDKSSGSTYYDIGVALAAYKRRLVAVDKQASTEKEAVKHFKEALRLDPSNDFYWNALANTTFVSEPGTAQHAYIRSLEIDSKNVTTWTNLGLFYLHHDDTELANEAFYKAQTLDPDYALAWVGQGLVATSNGHEPEARALFEHAVGLTATVPEADVEFAKRLFNTTNKATQWMHSSEPDPLIPAFFVLDRYCKQRPRDESALHLFGLICERIGHVELGIEVIGRAIELLEAMYEETEDPIIEKQFSIAHTNMGRLRLAVQDYDGALESYQVVIGLLQEVEDSNSRKLLCQAQMGSGLAHVKLGQLEEALGLFELALATAADDIVLRSHVIILLAQTLWAVGTENGRESAKAQLLQSIELDPENLTAINNLAGMGILTDDDDLIDAALSEILALPLDQRLALDPRRDVTYLLVQHHLEQGDVSQAIAVAQKAVMAEPSRPEDRHRLASLTLQRGANDAALAILTASSSESNMQQQRKSLALQAVARYLSDTTEAEKIVHAMRLAQKAILLSPMDRRNWQTLAFVRSHAA